MEAIRLGWPVWAALVVGGFYCRRRSNRHARLVDGVINIAGFLLIMAVVMILINHLV